MQPHAAKGQRALFDNGRTKRKREEGDGLPGELHIRPNPELARMVEETDRQRAAAIAAMGVEDFVDPTATAPSKRGRGGRGMGRGSGFRENVAAQGGRGRGRARGRGVRARASETMEVSEEEEESTDEQIKGGDK